MKLFKMLTPPIKASVIALLAFSVFADGTYEGSWIGLSGKVTIPAGVTAPVTATELADFANVTEIAFADAEGAVTASGLTAELVLNATLSGAGAFTATGCTKVKFAGDSRNFDGVIAVTNTPVEVTCRYGLGSGGTKCDFYNDATAERAVLFSSTGADCVLDAPVHVTGKYRFGPADTADTLVISNDFRAAVLGAATTVYMYFSNRVRVAAGRFGADTYMSGNSTKSPHLYLGNTGTAAWLAIDGDTVMDTAGGLYFSGMVSGSTVEYGVTNEVSMSGFAPYTGSMKLKFVQPNVRVRENGTVGGAILSSGSATPAGFLDLNGCDQKCTYLGYLNGRSAGYHYVIRSDSPATLTMTDGGAKEASTAYIYCKFTGDVSVDVASENTRYLAFSDVASDSVGKLSVGGRSTLTLTQNACWAGTNVTVYGNGKLICAETASINKGVAELSVQDSGVLEIASGVTLNVCKLTIDETEFPARATAYTVSELAEQFPGRVTGSGSILLKEQAPEWKGWPAEPGQKAIVPLGTLVTVDTAEDFAKALACREIEVNGGAEVRFACLDGCTSLHVTNSFSGVGTITFKDIPTVYMAGDASGLVAPGHVAFDLCETIIVSNKVAIGGLDSGDCTVRSEESTADVTKPNSKMFFAGEGDLMNFAPVLYENAFVFGTLSDAARLYQTNSWRQAKGMYYNGNFAILTNNITFCAGTFGMKVSDLVQYQVSKGGDVRMTDNVRLSFANTVYIHADGADWRLASDGAASLAGAVHLGTSDGRFHFDCANALTGVPSLYLYNTGSNPNGFLDLNGYDQELPVVAMQANVTTPDKNPATAQNYAAVTSAVPAQIALTSTEGKTRDNINLRFLDKAGLWLKGTDNITLTREQSTSSGDLRVSNGTLTLKYSAAWAGGVIVDGGKLIVDATAGGKYLDHVKYADIPVFSRKANISVTDGGQLALGRDIAVRSIRTGEDTFLKPGVWGSSAALAAGKVDAQHVDDTLFDAGFAGTVSVRYNTDKPVGLSILVR